MKSYFACLFGLEFIQNSVSDEFCYWAGTGPFCNERRRGFKSHFSSPSYSSGYSLYSAPWSLMVTVWFRAIIESNTDILNWQFRYVLKLRLKTLTTRTSDTEPRKSANESPWFLIPVFISVFITHLMFVSWQCHFDPSFKTLKRVIKANEIVIKLIVSFQLPSSQ